MEAFIRGDDRSMELAAKIEVALSDLFGELQPFADLSLALASYRPGGGPYLYDDRAIAEMMRGVIPYLQITRPQGT